MTFERAFDYRAAQNRTGVLAATVAGQGKGLFAMAMVRVSPLPVEVRCGWLDGRPRSIRLAGETLPVVAVERVRRELAAYPRSTGPRTLFEIVTPSLRLQLGYRHRERRWSVEGIDPDGPEVARAA